MSWISSRIRVSTDGFLATNQKNHDNPTELVSLPAKMKLMQKSRSSLSEKNFSFLSCSIIISLDKRSHLEVPFMPSLLDNNSIFLSLTVFSAKSCTTLTASCSVFSNPNLKNFSGFQR
ncbi:hypothetical protein HanIR_Chr06g0273091 [Helianthus annuus]|nr:hypothetical protein HanIR_Chr06g0273091 [Helianthus annuus]